MTAPIKPGAPIIVTNGLAAGYRGTAIGLARVDFGGIPVWSVEFPLPLGTRAIRADYLQVAEVLS